jgi:predicted  nucleic acid-binding Zn-ribbon protein
MLSVFTEIKWEWSQVLHLKEFHSLQIHVVSLTRRIQSHVAQLETLQVALENVNCLEVDDAQQGEVVALQQDAVQCQKTIDAFWEKIKKYQPSLKAGGSGSKVKDGWMKIKWALCKKEDLSRFKLDLVGHIENIQMLLTTLRM